MKLAARHDDSDTSKTVTPPPPPYLNTRRPSPPSTGLGDIHTPRALTDLVEPSFRGKYSNVAIKTGAGPPSHPVPVALKGRLPPRTAPALLAALFLSPVFPYPVSQFLLATHSNACTHHSSFILSPRVYIG